MKKFPAILLMLITVLSLTGCSMSGVFEKEYFKISSHPETNSATDETGHFTVEVSNYDELVEAYLSMIRNYSSLGIVSFVNYDGDPSLDAISACSEVEYGTSLGIFAVYNITATIIQETEEHNLEAEISINYSKSIRQIKNLSTKDSYADVNAAIYKAIEDSISYTAFYTNLDIDQNYVKRVADNYYYSDATLSVFAPVTTTAVYPGLDGERIVEIIFVRQYSVNTIVDMHYSTIRVAKRYIDCDYASGSGEWLLYTCRTLSENVNYVVEDNQLNKTQKEYSAYGVFMEGRANSEGFAMAFKMLCDLNNVECYVVRGTLGGYRHCWNIVKLEGDYYHIDVSQAGIHGIENSFLTDDEYMSENSYVWDTSDYYACSGYLTYNDFMRSDILD